MIKFCKTIKCILSFIGILVVLFIKLGCRKIETKIMDETNIAVVTDKFFATKGVEDPVLLRVISEMKKRNANHSFVPNFVKKYGYPVWNKCTITLPNANKNDRSTSENNDTIITIPIVQNNIPRVYAAIDAIINDSISLSLFQSNQYKNYIYGGAGNTYTAEYYAKSFMLLEYAVFGYAKFNIKDDTLYRAYFPNVNFSTNHRFIRTEFKENSNGTNGRNTLLISQQPCQLAGVYEDPDGEWDNGDEIFTGQYVWIGNCSDYSPSGFTLGGFLGTGIYPPPGGSGGGGGSGSGGGGSGGGWTPIMNPNCDPFVIGLQNDLGFVNKLKFLNSSQALSNDKELGFLVRNRILHQYDSVAGLPDTKEIDFTSLITFQVDGIMHSHYNSLNSMFSPQDVLLMINIFISGAATDTSNLFFTVTSGSGYPYLLKVTNPTKFLNYANYIAARQRKNKWFTNKYDKKFNFQSTNRNEEEFLKMLKDCNAGNGLTLYRGDGNCNKWTKLELGVTGVTDVPCN
jgi:uncharacterized membrane protein YgcG